MEKTPQTNTLSTIEGRHETETCVHNHEANLHKHFVYCEKNPTHEMFIPAPAFNKSHLPSSLRDDAFVELIKSMCELTVCIHAVDVSKDRPSVYPDCATAFPFYKPGGGIRPRSGSGYITGVRKYGHNADSSDGEHCTCHICETSSSPQKSWWKIWISTAFHLVCDQREIETAAITLFYDDPINMESCVKVSGDMAILDDLEGDRFLFTAIIHDNEVGRRLKRARTRCRELRGVSKSLSNRTKHQPVVVISHPHGCSKQISVGHCVSEQKYKYDGLSYQYITHTSSTCPGSSGGLVWRVDTFPHSSALQDGSNRSGCRLNLLDTV